MSVYDPLRHHLLTLTVNRVRMKFSSIEAILGRNFPASARKYSAWWGNDDQGGTRHSAAWLKAGWIVEDLDLAGEEVSFVRKDRY